MPSLAAKYVARSLSEILIESRAYTIAACEKCVSGLERNLLIATIKKFLFSYLVSNGITDSFKNERACF